MKLFRGKHAPISAKVSNGTLAGLLSSGVVWALVTFVPAFHSGIPTAVAPLIPLGVSALGQFSAGWLSTHRPTADEVNSILGEFSKLEHLLHLVRKNPPTAPTAPSTGVPAQKNPKVP